METIITLLFILLPVVFKLISSKLEKSGQPKKAAKMREIIETLGGDDDDVDVLRELFGKKDDEPAFPVDEPAFPVDERPAAADNHRAAPVAERPVPSVDYRTPTESYRTTVDERPASVAERRTASDSHRSAATVRMEDVVAKHQARRPLKSTFEQKAKEEQQEKREKIDPRKLVIYSEIMKPKYTE